VTGTQYKNYASIQYNSFNVVRQYRLLKRINNEKWKA